MEELNLNLHRDKVEKLHLYGELDNRESIFIEKLFTRKSSYISRKELNYLMLLYSTKLQERYK